MPLRGRSLREDIEPGGVVGVGWNERSGAAGEGNGGGVSVGRGSERRRLRDRFFMKFSGFSDGFLRESEERIDSFECTLYDSEGRAVDVVETLILDVLACRGRVKDENDGLCGKPNRCADSLGGGVG